MGNKILIVDDQVYNINAIKIILKTLFRLDVENLVMEANNGKQAVEIVEKNILQNNGASMSF